ncbi:cysteine-rich repeat secretory protein 8-like [Dioscorea cayenensis subsp. rotundata]|uniref:Cysteine-rich repeat secretory protein 8-like n=1 Tax=Dioscorea cayennensis subsp. rotundata TaxID=55577 RepID=A0AB40BQ74_DIOCR|nr:cysteine-rich repeat secretory protein 8-like [Dioscorea cayenensis subsp. rotundata]
MASHLLHHFKALSYLFFLLFIYHNTAMATLTFKPIKANCATTRYTDNSPFSTNLKTLLSTLKDKSSSSISINETAGKAPATVFGLYFCTGDLSKDNCQACIQTAIKDIIDSCPSSKQAIIWYDYCELRYSDTNFFGLPDTNGFSMINVNENTTSSRPVEVVSQLVKDAPLAQPLMFKSQAFISESLYALAQCSSDLRSKGCSDCLTTIFANIKACCTSSKGWRFLAPSCWIRLLSSLTKNAPAMAGFFYTIVREKRNMLYGLALCRGDLQNKRDDCQSCLNDASRSIVEDCPSKAQAIEWYEKCFVKYSNQRFFGMLDTVNRTLCGVEQVSADADCATEKLARSLINDAVKNKKFVSAGKVVISSSLSSYVLVQCSRDLSKGRCMQCLQRGMDKVSCECKLTNGWRYLSGSCTLRYETFPFFDTAIISTVSL